LPPKNRPKCRPTHFCQNWWRSFPWKKSSPKIFWVKCQFSKNCPMYPMSVNSPNLGSMLWSQFSAIFDNFRRKTLSKANVTIKLLHNLAFLKSQKRQIFRRKYLKITTSVPVHPALELASASIQAAGYARPFFSSPGADSMKTFWEGSVTFREDVLWGKSRSWSFSVFEIQFSFLFNLFLKPIPRSRVTTPALQIFTTPRVA
jgi:hypothetical protein